MVDKTQPERQRRYRAKLRAQVAKASVELPARITQLEAENAQLQSRLNEVALISLSPAARAELDQLCAERGLTEAELIESLLIHLAKNRAKIAAKQDEQPAPAPVHVTAKCDSIDEDQEEYLALVKRRQQANTQPVPEAHLDDCDLDALASDLAAIEVKNGIGDV